MSRFEHYEPWYQRDTFTYKAAVEALTYCLKGKIEDEKLLASLIKEIVPESTDFGSSRGTTHSCIQNTKMKLWKDSNT